MIHSKPSLIVPSISSLANTFIQGKLNPFQVRVLCDHFSSGTSPSPSSREVQHFIKVRFGMDYSQENIRNERLYWGLPPEIKPKATSYYAKESSTSSKGRGGGGRNFILLSKAHIEATKEHFSRHVKPPHWSNIQSFIFKLSGITYSEYYIASHRKEWGVPTRERGSYLTSAKFKVLKEYYDSQKAPPSWEEIKSYAQKNLGIANPSKSSVYAYLEDSKGSSSRAISKSPFEFDPLDPKDDEAFVSYLSKVNSSNSTELLPQNDLS